MAKSSNKILSKIYNILYKTFGPQYWWPGDTQLEIIIGAVLTQNTNWGNVEKAIINLKKDKKLTPRKLKDISKVKLASLIKPSGYFNVKSKRIKALIEFLFNEYNGNLKKIEKEDVSSLRSKLLEVNGVGPETADSILLYAFDKPIFVVDNYTRRILSRHKIIKGEEDYHEIQKLFMKNLKLDHKLYNEFHALIVKIGKNFCRRTPLCEKCPLKIIKI